MKNSNSVVGKILQAPLVAQIFVAIILAALLASVAPAVALKFSVLGTLFVKALKAVAPILVFILVCSSIANRKKGSQSKMRPIITLYVLGTFFASLVAVGMSFMFPTNLVLEGSQQITSAPNGVGEVLGNLVLNVVDNPVNALLSANYIGILFWAILLGFGLHNAAPSTKDLIGDVADGVSYIVKMVIRFAPLGIFGLVSNTIATTGFETLWGYSHLLLVLLGAMAIVAFVVNPILVGIRMKKNPYPLVLFCLRNSGITAFFTRSSAANIPVNLQLCEELGLDEDTYSVSIPLGATVNMAGAAITIAVLSLAAVHTLGVSVDFPTALLLCVVSTLSACGASGVAGGSLLLIPLACSLFGISDEIAMQVVAIGFIIGVIQDSAETALNSSSDLLFTASV